MLITVIFLICKFNIDANLRTTNDQNYESLNNHVPLKIRYRKFKVYFK